MERVCSDGGDGMFPVHVLQNKPNIKQPKVSRGGGHGGGGGGGGDSAERAEGRSLLEFRPRR